MDKGTGKHLFSAEWAPFRMRSLSAKPFGSRDAGSYSTSSLPGGSLMGALLQDLRFAIRQLGKARSFGIATVLTLALGIGANTAVFSLVNTLLLKPLPVPHAEQIATLAPRIGHGQLGQPFSWNEYKEIRKESTNVFSDVFAYTLNIDGLAAPGQRPERLMTAFVSGNFFDALQLKPAAGRLFLSSEGEVLGQDAEVVLSYDYW